MVHQWVSYHTLADQVGCKDIVSEEYLINSFGHTAGPSGVLNSMADVLVYEVINGAVQSIGSWKFSGPSRCGQA
jgi:hypothetical protein